MQCPGLSFKKSVALSSAYEIGKKYRNWVSTQAEASNASIRSVLQDFSAGTDTSLSLLADIATNRELRRFAGSTANVLSRHTCELLIDELTNTYNDQKLDQARRFLEGFSGFVQNELTKPSDIPHNSVQQRPLANQNITSSKIISAWSLYGDGAVISIRALGRIETYIYYLIFIGIVDVLSAWQSTRNPTYFGWGLFSMSSVLWNFFATSLAITFHHLSGSGNSLSTMPAGEFATRGWNALRASFVASAYILGGLVLAILPGLFLSFRYMFVSQVAALEDCNIESSLKRSRLMSSFLGWRIIKATTMSLFTYLIVIAGLTAVLDEASTKTFGYNLITQAIASVWGVWVSGIVYCGYRKAISIIKNEEAQTVIPVP